VLRRLQKRIHVPLPDAAARAALITGLLGSVKAELTQRQLNQVVAATEGYSASDLTAVLKDSAMQPLRELNSSDLRAVKPEELRGVTHADIMRSVQGIHPSVSAASLEEFTNWQRDFGAA